MSGAGPGPLDSHQRALPLTSAESQVVVRGNPFSARHLSIPLTASSDRRYSLPDAGAAAGYFLPLGACPAQGVRQRWYARSPSPVHPSGQLGSRTPWPGCSSCLAEPALRWSFAGGNAARKAIRRLVSTLKSPLLKAAIQIQSWMNVLRGRACSCIIDWG